MKKTTVLMAVSHPLASRNLLTTDVLAELTRDPNLRLVLFVPDYKKAFYE